MLVDYNGAIVLYTAHLITLLIIKPVRGIAWAESKYFIEACGRRGQLGNQYKVTFYRRILLPSQLITLKIRFCMQR